MPQELNAVEREALKNALDNPDFAAGFKKFCFNRQERFTNRCRNEENQIPETLDAEMKKRTTVAQCAAIAKAYGQIETELRKAAMLAVVADGEE